MSSDVHNLERAVEREMALLRELPPVRPSAAAVARTREAVAAEAQRGRRFAARWHALRAWVGVAAAFALVVGWGLGGGVAPMSSAAEAEATLDAWGWAFDASGQWLNQVATTDEGYLAADMGDDVDLLFWTLEQSFDALNPL